MRTKDQTRIVVAKFLGLGFAVAAFLCFLFLPLFRFHLITLRIPGQNLIEYVGSWTVPSGLSDERMVLTQTTRFYYILTILAFVMLLIFAIVSCCSKKNGYRYVVMIFAVLAPVLLYTAFRYTFRFSIQEVPDAEKLLANLGPAVTVSAFFCVGVLVCTTLNFEINTRWDWGTSAPQDPSQGYPRNPEQDPPLGYPQEPNQVPPQNSGRNGHDDPFGG